MLEGIGGLKAQVTLVDAATKKVLGEGRPERTPPDPSRMKAEPQFSPDPDLPAGTLDVQVVGGPGQTEEPLPNVAIRVIPASSSDADSGVGAATGADGTVRLMAQASEPQKLVVTLNGRQLETNLPDLSKSGGKLAIRAHWNDSGPRQALIDVAGTQGQ